MTLWTAKEAEAATGGRAIGDWRVSGVSIDTRTIAEGDLFVALKAARDGHDFVAQALEKGAAAALVSHVPEGVSDEAPLLIVEDVLGGLEALGRAARARTKARVVAVTGSVGKTSTKEMLRAMLSAQGKTHAAEASYNNHWGVPLTLARMPAESDFAIIEIGMSAPGEIAPLAKMARPHVAMVTTVAAAHLEAFESLDGIAAEKATILEGLEPEGVAVLNADIDQAPVLATWARKFAASTRWFGKMAADYRLNEVHLHGETTAASAETPIGAVLYKIQSAGTHFAMNGLGALACVAALGGDLARAVAALGNWTPYKGRGARETVTLDMADRQAELTLFDDSYNANPTSLGAALDVLASVDIAHETGRVSKGRRIAVLGDMKELGTAEIDLHKAVGDLPAMAAVDVVHCVGPLMAHLHGTLDEDQQGLACGNAKEMAEALPKHLQAGDVVLVKGSLSTGLAAVVDAIRKMAHAKSN